MTTMSNVIPIVGSILICLALVVLVVAVMGRPDKGYDTSEPDEHEDGLL